MSNLIRTDALGTFVQVILPGIVSAAAIAFGLYGVLLADPRAEAERAALLNAESAIVRGLGPRPAVQDGYWMFDLCIFGGPGQPALCSDRRTQPPVYYVTDQHTGADAEYCRAFASTDLRAVLAFMAQPVVPYRDAACAPDGVWPDWSKEGTEPLPRPLDCPNPPAPVRGRPLS